MLLINILQLLALIFTPLATCLLFAFCICDFRLLLSTTKLCSSSYANPLLTLVLLLNSDGHLPALRHILLIIYSLRFLLCYINQLSYYLIFVKLYLGQILNSISPHSLSPPTIVVSYIAYDLAYLLQGIVFDSRAVVFIGWICEDSLYCS